MNGNCIDVCALNNELAGSNLGRAIKAILSGGVKTVPIVGLAPGVFTEVPAFKGCADITSVIDDLTGDQVEYTHDAGGASVSLTVTVNAVADEFISIDNTTAPLLQPLNVILKNDDGLQQQNDWLAAEMGFVALIALDDLGVVDPDKTAYNIMRAINRRAHAPSQSLPLVVTVDGPVLKIALDDPDDIGDTWAVSSAGAPTAITGAGPLAGASANEGFSTDGTTDYTGNALTVTFVECKKCPCPIILHRRAFTVDYAIIVPTTGVSTIDDIETEMGLASASGEITLPVDATNAAALTTLAAELQIWLGSENNNSYVRTDVVTLPGNEAKIYIYESRTAVTSWFLNGATPSNGTPSIEEHNGFEGRDI